MQLNVILDQFATVEFGALVTIVGAITEALKRLLASRLFGSKVTYSDKKVQWFKAAMALLPVIIGAILGPIILGEQDQAATAYIMGAIGGVFASQGHNLLQPASRATIKDHPVDILAKLIKRVLSKR